MKELWVNVGSGLHWLPGFVNLDNSVYLRLSWLAPVGSLLFGREKSAYLRLARKGLREGAIRRHDCRKALPFADATVDHILASHILEHLYPEQVSAVLADFRRALRPGGTLHVIVPDLEKLAQTYLSHDADSAADEFISATILSQRSRPSLRYRCLQFLGYEGLQHRWMYDGRSMSALFTACGLEVVPHLDTPSAQVRWDCPESVHVYGRRLAEPGMHGDARR